MTANPSLLGIVSRRIFAYAALAMLLQTAIVFMNYWFNDLELSQLFVEHESQIIADDYYKARADGSRFPSEDTVRRYSLDEASSTYLLRVTDRVGRVIYTNCSDCQPHFLPREIDAPTFWFRTIRPGKPLTLVGGKAFPSADGRQLNVELASLGDANSLVNDVIANEVLEHMVWPMGLMLVVVMGASVVSIRMALRPVSAAAAAADALDPRQPLEALPVAALPIEIARLVGSVNRAFEKVAELVRSQKIFTASIAHEIRTPASIIKLEIAQIDDPRARKIERDLDALTHTLQQLTSLARINASETEQFQVTDIAGLVADVVEQIAPLVYAGGKSISFNRLAAPKASVSPALIITLVRNLIENSVRHTPEGTRIVVSVEEPAAIVVSDDGPGFSDAPGSVDTELAVVHASGASGIGLKIVRSIAELHGGSLSLVSSASGVMARVDLKPHL